MEEERLHALLAPLGLAVRDIPADGHCLYRAVAHQLTLPATNPGTAAATAGGGMTYQQLRTAAAQYIRAHPDEFVPFLMEEDADAADPQEALQQYCKELESTAVWGGQLELSALAHVLKRHIKVYAVGMPVVSLGEEYAGGGVLQLCYLRHAISLGEHYNSCEPQAAADANGAGKADAAAANGEPNGSSDEA